MHGTQEEIAPYREEMSPEEILQNYIWRWEIEVNIRDEKTLIGCGQAQVRNEHSAADVPSFVSAMYAFLLLASIRAYNENEDRKIEKSCCHGLNGTQL